MSFKSQQACRFGNKCNRPPGACNFAHPQRDDTNQPQQNYNSKQVYQKSSFQHHRIKQGDSGQNGNNPRYEQNKSYVSKGGHQGQGYQGQQNQGYQGQQGQGYQGNQGQQGQGYQGNQGNQGQGGNYHHQNPKDKGNNDLSFTLCRNFHFSEPCQYQNCKKKHQFIFDQADKIKRINFTHAVPNHIDRNKNYFCLRLANVITFLEFNIESQELLPVFNWNLPELNNAKYNYYYQKEEYIYFSYANPQTTLAEIGLFHINSQKMSTISNSNNGIVTGLAHFSQNILLSTSTAGELKVWIKEGENYITHVQSNMKLQNYFNPTNVKVSLLFLDVSEFNGIKIMTIGTNDRRLLFFIGADLNFHQVSFNNEAYSNVYAVRYAKKQEVPYAIVLVWNQKHTVSTLLEVNLTNFQHAPLIQSQNPADYSRNNICMFQFVGDMFIVGTLGGMLSIYKFPECQKIGAMWHQNTVTDVVFSEESIITTGVQLKYMFLLQKKSQKKEGSLGCYIVK